MNNTGIMRWWEKIKNVILNHNIKKDYLLIRKPTTLKNKAKSKHCATFI